MKHQEYNGWTNQETWLVNMWFGDEFIYNLIKDEFIYNLIKEDGVSDAETLKDIMEEYILPEIGDGGSRNGYITDVLAFTLHEVNWKEIFEHYETEE
jgi:hypothetical protein